MRVSACLSIFMIVLAVAADASAELYLKQVAKGDEFYDGYPQGGEEITLEMWFGERRLAVVTDGRRIIFEPGERRLRIISEPDTSYCDIPLPVVRDSVLAPELKARHDRWFYDGNVTKTAETKEVNGRRCIAFMGQQWIQLGEDRFSEIDKSYWMTTDIPTECRLFRDLEAAILSLVNSSPDYLGAVKKFEGLLLAGEVIAYDRGNKITMRIHTDAFEERTPPEGIYAVPAGFRKVAKLPREMLLVMLRIPN